MKEKYIKSYQNFHMAFQGKKLNHCSKTFSDCRMKTLLLTSLILFTQHAHTNPKLNYEMVDSLNTSAIEHISVGKYKEFKNYILYLTPYNTILPGDRRTPDLNQTTNYRDDVLDEKSINFQYGQFSIYIESEKFPILDCNGIIEIRMPQTLYNNNYSEDSKNPSSLKYIKEKQELFFNIKEMLSNRSRIIKVIVEPHTGCNAFFRHANGRYVDYEGQYKNQQVDS